MHFYAMLIFKLNKLMKKPVSVFIALLIIQISLAQHKTENLVIVTLDGMRWQEVFKGC
jgi:hypothetical protein